MQLIILLSKDNDLQLQSQRLYGPYQAKDRAG